MIIATPKIELVIEKCTDFVLEHRKKKAFVGWSKKEIYDTLFYAMCNQVMLYGTDEQGNIVGVVHGVVDHKEKLFHVVNALAIRDGIFRTFVDRYTHMFPEYRLQGMRFDKLKVYNTPRFIKKVLANKN